MPETQRRVRDTDIEHLLLSNKSLTVLPNLSNWKNLTVVWLSGNKLKSLGDSFRCLCAVEELYLHDNQLLSVNSAIFGLTCMKILTLHRNQLTDINDTTNELRFMRGLHRLTLFDNPLCYRENYRETVLHNVPSLKTGFLDRRAVNDMERRNCEQLYQPDRYRIRSEIAFLKRPAPLLATEEPLDSNVAVNDDSTNNIDSQTKADEKLTSPTANPLEKPQVKVNPIRQLPKRSTWEFSMFDWSIIELSKDKRLDPNLTTEPRLVVKRF